MKNINKLILQEIHKLYENPDRISAIVRGEDVYVGYASNDSIVFGYLNNQLIVDYAIPHYRAIGKAIINNQYSDDVVNERRKEIYNNPDMVEDEKQIAFESFANRYSTGARHNMKHDGRLWTDKKIITFWKYPDNKMVLYRILKEIETRTQQKIIDNNYVIEVYEEDNWDDPIMFIPIENYDGKYFVEKPNKPHDMPAMQWQKQGGKKGMAYNTQYINKRKEKGVKKRSGTAAEYNFITQKNVAEEILNEVENLLNDF